MRYGLLFSLTVICIIPAHAYIDPGTGSMILQIVVGVLFSILVFIKTKWNWFVKLFSHKRDEK